MLLLRYNEIQSAQFFADLKGIAMASRKEFTIADMIKTLEKLDPELPVYDHYYDDEENAEIWFNVAKPTPKKKTIYLTAQKEGKNLIVQWSDDKNAGQIIEKKKVVILYPPATDEIEF